MPQHEGLCGICPAGCWVKATVEGGRLTAVEPLPDHPLGIACAIGRRSPDIVYDPDRLRYPLRRKGPKGTYDFERISWDEAFETITKKLLDLKAAHGPESAAIYTGRGSFDMALCDLFQPAGVAVSSASSVLFPFGSPNTLGVGALCYVAFAMIAPHVTMGELLITMDTDLEQSELIVLWGANPATDSPPLAHEQILRAKARGAEVVAIDPRYAETAAAAGAEWIPIRPGTDGALALGLVQVLLEEELHDEPFAKDWTLGFDALSKYVQNYRPDAVARITGVPEDTIRQLARRIARARGACPVMYSGLEYSDSGVQAIRAVFTLFALAGQLDVPGGITFRMRSNGFPQNRRHLIPNPDMTRALGRDRFPVYSHYRGESHAIALPRSVLDGDPYKIRALIVLGGSIITAWPNPAIWRSTFEALDFLVTINRYHTADSAYADIVLPATTQYEITSYMRYGPLFKIREKLIEPVGEARSDLLILSELAARLGYGHLYPQTEEEALAWALEGTGFTVEGVRANGGVAEVEPVMMQYKKWEKGLLRPDGQPGFDTPSGKFEIASSILAEHGYDALPVYTEPKEGPLAQPELAARYPLVLNSGSRTPHDFRSQHHGVKNLADKLPEPVVTLNLEDARSRGIREGDAVWLESPRGRLRYRARLTGYIVRGTVDASMGGGGPLGPAAWRDTNINDLTDLENYDPISGFPVYKTLLCEVARADGHDAFLRDPGAVHADTSPSARADAPRRAAFAEARLRREVYLDHNATTPVDPEVLEVMLPFLRDEAGNPSSVHTRGTRARSAVEAARRTLAQALNCTARRIVFTGSGSEADNLALFGAAQPATRAHVVTSAIEHPAVLATARALEARGFELTVLPVDSDGRVDPEIFERALRPDTVLASVMLANNETGVLEDIPTLARIARGRGVLFHTDAVQAFGKIPVDVEALGVDLLSLSAHKIHGPKGVGALYVRKDTRLAPLVYGGGQERGLRSGTENVPGLAGFGKAAELANRRRLSGDLERTRLLRDRLEGRLREVLPEARRNGPAADRLPNTLSLTLPGIRGESLVLLLDRRGVYFSSGSACKSGHPDPSPALLAMGLTPDEAHRTVRFSLGSRTTAEDVDHAVAEIAEVVRDTTSAIRFVACR